MKPALKVVSSTETETEAVSLGTHVARLREWTDAGPRLMLAGREHLVSKWCAVVTQADLQAACAAQTEALVVCTESGELVLMSLLAQAKTAALDVHVDGARVELVAQEELVLRCGEATVRLTKDGRLFIRGVEVETRAKGAHRIRGGSVEIN